MEDKLDLILGELRGLNVKVDVLADGLEGLTERVDLLTERVDDLTERVDKLTVQVGHNSAAILEAYNDVKDNRIINEKEIKAINAKFIRMKNAIS
ncbi:MAG: hypothetical protein M0Z31_02200 [Clostridia bacterium]|nr:hypothetical protein [Clostridia bacterium]